VTGRTVVSFWTAVSVAVILLGAGVATAQRLARGGSILDVVILGLIGPGLLVCILVAARIAYVVGRLQRPPRRD